MNSKKSIISYQRACAVIPGGVNSPVRSFNAVGGNPIFIEKGAGSKIYDIDGNEYIDYVCSWGPLILGHCDRDVVNAVIEASEKGTSFGAPTLGEVRLAELITQQFPSVEKVRLVNSGTEAVASAIRLARAYTGKSKIIKAAGCYHGHVDSLLVQSGSGVASLGIPGSSGITNEQARQTIVVGFNDIDAVNKAFEQFSNEIAAIILEPIAGNMGVIPPKEGYLSAIRQICDKHKSLLILDEVITGFRVSLGGAQKLFDVRADITILGKIIGGGLPVGAYGSRAEIMDLLAPLGPVYQAGTLSGNPLAVAAGIATIEKLISSDVYAKLEKRSSQLEQGLLSEAKRLGVAITINRVGSMMSIFFSDKPVENYDDARASDVEKYNKFFHLMLEKGIYLAPSAFETMFVSYAHSDDDLQITLDCARKSFEELDRNS